MGAGGTTAAGPTAALPGKGFLCLREAKAAETASLQPRNNPLTGEPCAGDPPARFGGRGGASQCAVPTSIWAAAA